MSPPIVHRAEDLVEPLVRLEPALFTLASWDGYRLTANRLEGYRIVRFNPITKRDASERVPSVVGRWIVKQLVQARLAELGLPTEGEPGELCARLLDAIGSAGGEAA